MNRFERGFHVPIDDLREWVVSGCAHPIGWTDETTRQFLLAEDGACDLARLYDDAGFAVALDHGSRTTAFDNMAARNLVGRNVQKILLLAETDLNLDRNRTRTNKTFSHEVLIPTIKGLNAWYRDRAAEMADWLVVPNNGTVEEAVDFMMPHLVSTK